MSKLLEIAISIINLQRGIQLATDLQRGSKNTLISLVGDEGQTIDTPDGKVTVTKRTLDRPSGVVKYSLDPAKFLELDVHVQANLIKQGIVVKGGTTITGQAPIVKVTLK